jgi:hypothetical protein
MVVRALTTAPNAITNAPLRAEPAAQDVRRAVLLAYGAQSSLKAGEHARLIVQLRDGDNADLREPHVSIELRSTTLGGSAPAALRLLANGQPMPSSGRATALTDNSGRANFDVTSVQPRQDPIVFRGSHVCRWSKSRLGHGARALTAVLAQDGQREMRPRLPTSPMIAGTIVATPSTKITQAMTSAQNAAAEKASAASPAAAIKNPTPATRVAPKCPTSQPATTAQPRQRSIGAMSDFWLKRSP